MNIIIVDDEYYARKALTKIIRDIVQANSDEPFRIHEFECAEDVVAQLGKLDIDIVFTDIRMNEMDGIDLCGHLRRYNPAISLVIISGYEEFHYAQQAIRHNVSGYLSKPVNEEEIKEVVCRILDSPRLPSPGEAARIASIDTRVPVGATQYLDQITKQLIRHYLTDNQSGQILDVAVKQIRALYAEGKIGNQDCRRFLQELCLYIDGCLRTITHQREPHIFYSEESLAQVGDLGAAQDFIADISETLNRIMASRVKKEKSLAEEITSYIQEHYSENLTLHDLAKTKWYIHPNYLSKIIKTHTGLSFSKYLLDVRMKNAQKLLEREDLNITIVSQLSGYNSSSHFVQMFKRYYGYTPGVAKKRDESSRPLKGMSVPSASSSS